MSGSPNVGSSAFDLSPTTASPKENDGGQGQVKCRTSANVGSSAFDLPPATAPAKENDGGQGQVKCRPPANVGRSAFDLPPATAPAKENDGGQVTVVRDRSNVGPRQTSAALLLTCPQQLPRRKRMTERGFRDRSNVGARQTLAALLLTCPQQPPRRKRMTVVRDRSNVGPRQTLAALLFDLSPATAPRAKENDGGQGQVKCRPPANVGSSAFGPVPSNRPQRKRMTVVRDRSNVGPRRTL